jgi:hypothetical protein
LSPVVMKPQMGLLYQPLITDYSGALACAWLGKSKCKKENINTVPLYRQQTPTCTALGLNPGLRSENNDC